MRRGPVSAALLAGAVLAACGRDDPPVGGQGDIFLRDVPEQEAPIRPAPDLADIRPVPDLDHDRKALAMICSAAGWLDGETCGCVARGAADQFRGRSLAWFAARLMDDPAEQAHLETLLPQQTHAELVASYGRVVEQCAR